MASVYFHIGVWIDNQNVALEQLRINVKKSNNKNFARILSSVQKEIIQEIKKKVTPTLEAGVNNAFSPGHSEDRGTKQEFMNNINHVVQNFVLKDLREGVDEDIKTLVKETILKKISHI